jgi:penicillin-binding protein-related factor A (putative recombinase)
MRELLLIQIEKEQNGNKGISFVLFFFEHIQATQFVHDQYLNYFYFALCAKLKELIS